MSVKNTVRSDTTDKVMQVIGWYQPHSRASDFDNRVLDKKTGELKTLPSRTKQSFLEECDINNIIRDFKVTGQIAHMNTQRAQGAYLDLPDPLDFQESLQLVKDAQTSFATLPSAVRTRFGNDPTAFLQFMSDPKNQEEIIKLGLATDNRPPPPPAGSAAAPAAAVGAAAPTPSQTKA